jgi:multidrug resistance efflux pump
LIDYRKYGLTAAIVLVTVIAMLLTYWDNLVNPWTRDGQVRAEVIQITPRVSGPLVDLPVADNQYVRAGDLLFEIDPRTFQATYDQKRAALDSTGDDVQALAKQVQSAEAGVAVAKAGLAQARTLVAEADATIEKNQAEYQRQQEMLPKKATSQKAVDRAKANYTVALEQRKASVAGIGEAQASLAQAEAALAEARAQLGAAGDANADIRQAQAALRQAELDLEFTKVRAPVDGYVTNLNLRTGSFAVFQRNPGRRDSTGGRRPGDIDGLPRSADIRSCRQHGLGHCPAGWQHGIRVVTECQSVVRLDTSCSANPGADRARGASGWGRIAGRDHGVRAGEDGYGR